MVHFQAPFYKLAEKCSIRSHRSGALSDNVRNILKSLPMWRTHHHWLCVYRLGVLVDLTCHRPKNVSWVNTLLEYQTAGFHLVLRLVFSEEYGEIPVHGASLQSHIWFLSLKCVEKLLLPLHWYLYMFGPCRCQTLEIIRSSVKDVCLTWSFPL